MPFLAIPTPYDASAIEINPKLLKISWLSPTDTVDRYKISILLRQTQQIIQTIYTGKFKYQFFNLNIDETFLFPNEFQI